MSPLAKTLLIFLPIIAILAIIGPRHRAPEETESIAQKLGISEVECRRRLAGMQRQIGSHLFSSAETERACSFRVLKTMSTDEAIEAYRKSK